MWGKVSRGVGFSLMNGKTQQKKEKQEVAEKAPENAGISLDGVFVGQCEHALDPKKRLTMPREWRDALGASQVVYVFPNSDGCLDLVPKSDMDQKLAKLREKRLFDKQVNALLLKIGSNSEQVPLDGQGRMRICDRLLGFAGLTGKVQMMGAVRMIKLYAPGRMPTQEPVNIEDFDAATEALEF